MFSSKKGSKCVSPNNFDVRSSLLIVGVGSVSIVHWVSKKLKRTLSLPVQINIAVVIITGFM